MVRWRPGGLAGNPDFVRLWIGQTVSEFGSRITRDGLPLVAVLVLGAGPLEMGLLAAIGTLPVILVGLPAGVWADCFRRRPILITADIGRALLLWTIPLAALLGLLRAEQLFVIAGLAGILTVFFDVAYQSYLPSIVARELLAEGNSRLSMSTSIAEIGGPALAGVLVQTLTAPIAILFDAISFLVSALFISRIQTPDQPARSGEIRQGVLREVTAGLRVVSDSLVLRALMGSSGTMSFFGGFFGSLYYLYAINGLGFTPALLGLLIACGGVGALIGALLVSWSTRRFGLGGTMIGSVALTGVSYLMIPLAGSSLVGASLLMGAAQFLGDLTWTVYSVCVVSLRQAVTLDNFLGRVNASTHVLEGMAGVAGLIIGGFLGQTIGLRMTLFIGAVGILLASQWLVFSPVRSLRRYPLTSEPGVGG